VPSHNSQSSEVCGETYEAQKLQGQALRVDEMSHVSSNITRSVNTGPKAAASTRAAFIGTRRVNELTDEDHRKYLDAVDEAVRRGHIIRTGAAKGTDQIAAARALYQGGIVELVLPWTSYESDWVATYAGALDSGRLKIEVYHEATYPFWTASVDKYHPAPHQLTSRVRALHARNYGIVAKTQYVVALVAPDRKGGTEQGIRIAKALGIRVLIIGE